MSRNWLKYCFYSSSLCCNNIINGMEKIKSIFSTRIKSTDIEKIEKVEKDNKIVNFKEITVNAKEELTEKYFRYINEKEIKYNKDEKDKFIRDRFEELFSKNVEITSVNYYYFWKSINNKSLKNNKNKKNITELNIIIPKSSFESLKLNIENCNFSDDLKKEEKKFDQKIIFKEDTEDDLMKKINETLKNLKGNILVYKNENNILNFEKKNNILVSKIEGNISNFKEKLNEKDNFEIITSNNNHQ